MRQFSKVAKATQQAVIVHAQKLSYFGKRNYDVKLGLCEAMLQDVDLLGKVEVSNLLDWLEDNKPVTTTKKAVANKPAANTMTGNQTARRAAMQTLDANRFYVITAAQNNTAVNMPALNALKDFCGQVGAELVALPIFYNKNAFSATVESENERFDDAIKDFMVFDDSFIFSERAVKICAEAAILPTAKQPVNAAKLLNSGEGLTLVGSTKQQFGMMPVLPDEPLKAAASTGCVTTYNYTRSRAGAEAEKDHKFGALLVWVSGDGVQFTNLQVADNGSLQYYLAGESYHNLGEHTVAKLGDLHCEMFEPKCWEQTLTNLREMQPSRIAVEDILHFSSRSHHNRHSGKHLYAVQGETVKGELTQVITQLNQLAEIVPDVYVTESNHNSALDVWLDDKTYNSKGDPVNAKLYHLLNWAVCEMLDDDTSEDCNALQLALEIENELSGLPALADNIRFGRGDVSEMWNNTEMSQHGHKGQNGSFGSPALFAKWGLNLATGHTHSPSLIGNVITCGVTASKKQGYNRLGASSWGQADSVIHDNGTQQLVFKELFPL